MIASQSLIPGSRAPCARSREAVTTHRAATSTHYSHVSVV